MQRLKDIFEGRLNRKQFFWGSILATVVFGFITYLLLVVLIATLFKSIVVYAPFYILMLICDLPMLIAVSSLAARRFQDMNITGEYFIFIAGSQYIYSIVASQYGLGYLAEILLCVLFIEWLILILLPGTKGLNKYGPESATDMKLIDALLNRKNVKIGN